MAYSCRYVKPFFECFDSEIPREAGLIDLDPYKTVDNERVQLRDLFLTAAVNEISEPMSYIEARYLLLDIYNEIYGFSKDKTDPLFEVTRNSMIGNIYVDHFKSVVEEYKRLGVKEVIGMSLKEYQELTPMEYSSVKSILVEAAVESTKEKEEFDKMSKDLDKEASGGDSKQ